MLFDRIVVGNKMTSETSDKTPLIVSTAVIGNIGRHKPLIGVFFVLLSWLYIYFQVIWSLYEGILDFSDTSGARSKTIDKYDVDDSIVFGSAKYFMLCGLGGIFSCGLTHTAIVPLDLVNPGKYTGVLTGFSVTVREEGMRGLAKGWAPTLIGYSLQGLAKFGCYEWFKIFYSDILGPELSYTWRTSVYLAASASAELIADVLLAPMEATKVRIQTSPSAPPHLRGCAPMIYRTEGIMGFYKGLPPLWMRQIPYTMMKFACFERTVEALYKYVVPRPRAECTKPEQLAVTFLAGYIAGVFCAIVSHPADTIVSKLNQERGSSALGVAKKLGMRGLWKGLIPRIFMIGTLTALQWFIYDSVKVTFKMPRPPPADIPESLRIKLHTAVAKL